MSLPDSRPEKRKSFEEEQRLEYWVYIHELKKLLDSFEDDDWIAVNKLGNLVVYREGHVNPSIGGNMVGYIDLHWTKVDIST